MDIWCNSHLGGQRHFTCHLTITGLWQLAHILLGNATISLSKRVGNTLPPTMPLKAMSRPNQTAEPDVQEEQRSWGTTVQGHTLVASSYQHLLPPTPYQTLFITEHAACQPAVR
jgi:hypothetical protein